MSSQQMHLGRVNRLTVSRRVEFGLYLDGGSVLGDVLLPRAEAVGDPQPGDEVEAFLYLDHEERVVATMRQPLAQVGDFAHLEVAWVNNYGAFLNWGLQKDLFVPFREQKMKMQKGQRYMVHVHLDPDSYRIMASAKVERYLCQDAPPYRRGDRVDALVWQKTDLGFKVIADNQWGALIYGDQVFRPLRTGDRVTAWVQTVRPDGKLDLMLQAPGQAAATDFARALLEHLQQNGGHTAVGDRSQAEEIYAMFGVSKKVFKKAVGDLYKQRLITIEPDGLRLV